MGDVWGDGLSDETIHQVTLDDFYISKFEITHEEYLHFLNDIDIKQHCFLHGNQLLDMDSQSCAIGYKDSSFYFKSTLFASSENNPVVEVTWFGALEFCNWKSRQENLKPCYKIKNRDVTCNWDANGYRLPTEAEWEYAARSGGRKDQKWSGTNKRSEIGKYTWYQINSKLKTHKVGQKKPNKLGIYDMSGNVWEWCWDRYGKYPKAKQKNPTGARRGEKRILRGGGFHSGIFFLRNSYRRYPKYPIFSGNDIGFRIVRSSR